MEKESKLYKDPYFEKMRRVKSALADMKDGEFSAPTPFMRSINIHKDTGDKYLDDVKTWQIFFEQNPNLIILQDNGGEYKMIGKEKVYLKKEDIINQMKKLLDKQKKDLLKELKEGKWSSKKQV